MSTARVEYWKKDSIGQWMLLRTAEAETTRMEGGYVLSPFWPDDLPLEPGDEIGVRVLAHPPYEMGARVIDPAHPSCAC